MFPTTTTESSRNNRRFLRAHLPNQTRTSVEVVEGLRLCEALMKPLRRRDLDYTMCVVMTRLYNGVIVDWSTDISTLQVEEVYVCVLDDYTDKCVNPNIGRYNDTYGCVIMKSIGHQFIRKTFFTLAFCECCRRLLFTGLYCHQCNFRFHQRCASGVPAECNRISMGPCRGYDKIGGFVSAINAISGETSKQFLRSNNSRAEMSAGILNVCGDTIKTGR